MSHTRTTFNVIYKQPITLKSTLGWWVWVQTNHLLIIQWG